MVFNYPAFFIGKGALFNTQIFKFILGKIGVRCTI